MTVTALSKSTDQAAMNAWGRMSGDLNPLHCDPEYASDSRYGGTIMHGHMTIAWLMEWAADRFGESWFRGGQIRELRFRRPLRPGVEYSVQADPERDADLAVGVVVVEPDGTVAVRCLAQEGDGSDAR